MSAEILKYINHQNTAKPYVSSRRGGGLKLNPTTITSNILDEFKKIKTATTADMEHLGYTNIQIKNVFRVLIYHGEIYNTNEFRNKRSIYELEDRKGGNNATNTRQD